MKVVRLSALAPAAFTPQEIFLVLISVRGWVVLRATVRPEGLSQWKILQTTPSGIKPATFRFVTQCFNQARHQMPLNSKLSHCLILLSFTYCVWFNTKITQLSANISYFLLLIFINCHLLSTVSTYSPISGSYRKTELFLAHSAIFIRQPSDTGLPHYFDWTGYCIVDTQQNYVLTMFVASPSFSSHFSFIFSLLWRNVIKPKALAVRSSCYQVTPHRK